MGQANDGGKAPGRADPRLGRMRAAVLAAGAGAWVVAAAALASYRWQALPLSLMWAVSCFAVGGLIGFLFGIPRTGRQVPVAPAGGTAPAAGSPPPAVRPNTNLEEVSDWLTKILIGVTLTQYDQFRRGFQETAGVFARALGDQPSDLGFASAVMVAFSVGGWLFGYLLTLSSAPVLARALTAVERLAQEVRGMRQELGEVTQEVGRMREEAARVLGPEAGPGRRVSQGRQYP